MTKLFVSFTSILRGLFDGSISDLDLFSGLYYFGCSRNHAFAPWGEGSDNDSLNNELNWFTEDADARAAVHRKLVAVLESGEADGRVIWRDSGKSNSFVQLNELLVANGYAAIDARRGLGYCYPAVQERIDERDIDIDVVY